MRIRDIHWPAILALTCTGLALAFHLELAARKQSLTDLHEESSKLMATPAGAHGSASSTEATRAPAETNRLVRSAPPILPHIMGGGPNPSQYFARNAAFKQAYLNAYRANVEFQYALFAANAKLSDSQIDRFRSILVEDAEAWCDLIDSLASQNVDLNAPIYARMRQEQADAKEAALRSLLSQGQYEQLTQYRGHVGALEIVNEVVAQTAFADVQPSREELQRLAELFVSAGISRDVATGQPLPVSSETLATARMKSREAVRPALWQTVQVILDSYEASQALYAVSRSKR